MANAVLTLAAQRRSLEDQINERRREKASLIIEQAGVWETWSQRRALHFLLDKTPDIAALDPIPSAEEGRRLLQATDIDQEAFSSSWDSIAQPLREERAIVEADMRRFPHVNVSFESWIDQHHIDLQGRVEWAARAIFNHLQGIDPRVWTTFLSTSAGPEWQARMHERREREQERRNQELNEIIAKAESLWPSVTRAQSDERYLTGRLGKLHYPEHLRRGAAALVILTGTGIIVPLWFIPQMDSSYRAWHWWVVVGGFIIGLFAVALYVASVATSLAPPPPRASIRAKTRSAWRAIGQDLRNDDAEPILDGDEGLT